MNTPIKILGFAGSLRKDSLNKKLLVAAQKLCTPEATVEIFDLKDIPLYNEDVEAAGVPESVQLFKDHIAAADAVLIATPEYNHSMPAVTKNALDWASRSPNNVFNEKPVAVMGTSNGITGATRAQQHLIPVLGHLNAFLLHEPEVMVPNGNKKFDVNGNLIDEKTTTKLKELLTALNVWTIRVSK